MMNKFQCEKLHAKRRAMERLGFNLNKYARRDLVKLIQERKLEFLYKQSHRVTVYRANINGQDVDVVYDKKRHTIITFLFPEEAKFYEQAKAVHAYSHTSKKDAEYIPYVKE